MIDVEVVVVRLAMALAFGALIGIEREWRAKHAGLKTLTLVALGAAAFAIVSDTFGDRNHNPGQIAAAVVGGIGFIGAGVIMHRGGSVQGVTTAATLWVSASVGVACGLGQYPLAAVLTACILLVQFGLRQVEQMIDIRRDVRGMFEMRVDCEGETLSAVNAVWKRRTDIVVLRHWVKREKEFVTVRLTARTQPQADVSALEEELVKIEGVLRVDVRNLGVEE